MSGRLIRTALVAVIVWAFFVYAGGRALDQEFASAGALSERAEVNRPDVASAGQNVGNRATGRPIARSESVSGGIGTSLIVNGDGLVREYGHGLVAVNGHGPEWHRWQRVKADRGADKLQLRLTVRVLQVQSLRRQVALLDRLNFDPVLAIRVVFGPYSEQAIRVSRCETGGTFYLGASNGQYRGLFQMGSGERARYGHGDTALEQARAAYAYFVVSGRDWSPWECKP